MTETIRNVCDVCDNKKCKWCNVEDPYPGFICTIDQYGYDKCPDKNCNGVVFRCMNNDNYQEDLKSCYTCKYIPLNFLVTKNTD
jgi:hypothetical protein